MAKCCRYADCTANVGSFFDPRICPRLLVERVCKPMAGIQGAGSGRQKCGFSYQAAVRRERSLGFTTSAAQRALPEFNLQATRRGDARNRGIGDPLRARLVPMIDFGVWQGNLSAAIRQPYRNEAGDRRWRSSHSASETCIGKFSNTQHPVHLSASVHSRKSSGWAVIHPNLPESKNERGSAAASSENLPEISGPRRID